MGITDYYFLLGLPRFAPLDEVKAAYRKLAAQYHPDKVAELGPEAEQEATAKMQELNEAMAVLSDPARRQQYHQLLDLIPERPLSPPPKPKPKLPPRPATPSVEAVPEPSQPQPPPPEPEEKRDLLVEEQLRGIRDAVRKAPLKWKEKKLRGNGPLNTARCAAVFWWSIGISRTSAACQSVPWSTRSTNWPMRASWP
jgi:hypothetical protein